MTKYFTRLFESAAAKGYVANVDISSSGQSSVDFADVMKTERFREDLEAIRRIASLVDGVKS